MTKAVYFGGILAFATLVGCATASTPSTPEDEVVAPSDIERDNSSALTREDYLAPGSKCTMSSQCKWGCSRGACGPEYGQGGKDVPLNSTRRTR